MKTIKLNGQELIAISIREIFVDYKNDINGASAMNGNLNIRPQYQREFIYSLNEQQEVIRTILLNQSLGLIYWSKNDDGSYEIIDGQQRITSIMEYLSGNFEFENMYQHSLSKEELKTILDYELIVEISTGTSLEKLKKFERVNIIGEQLNKQELRNAMFVGTWINDLRARFSRPQNGASDIAKDYIKGSAIRQDYLETILKWKAKADNVNSIEKYMSLHQHDPNAINEWSYFRNTIDWVKTTFSNYRKEMKGIDWGDIYNKYGSQSYDSKAIEGAVKVLMADEDVTKKAGIYPYIFDKKEKHLNIRAFTPNQKRQAYENQNGICPVCGEHFQFEEMAGDHIKPWSKGGKTTIDNLQMLCIADNMAKGAN